MFVQTAAKSFSARPFEVRYSRASEISFRSTSIQSDVSVLLK